METRNPTDNIRPFVRESGTELRKPSNSNPYRTLSNFRVGSERISGLRLGSTGRKFSRRGLGGAGASAGRGGFGVSGADRAANRYA